MPKRKELAHKKKKRFLVSESGIANEPAHLEFKPHFLRHFIVFDLSALFRQLTLLGILTEALVGKVEERKEGGESIELRQGGEKNNNYNNKW